MCPVLSPVVWCSCGCNAAPVHLLWACGAVLSPSLQEAAYREQTTLSQNDLTSSQSSCEKPYSSGLELLVRRDYYPWCLPSYEGYSSEMLLNISTFKKLYCQMNFSIQYQKQS